VNIARSSTDVLCAQFCQNNHRECRALSQNQAHVRAHCGAQTDATMKISMCARVMIFFQPLLLVNFVFDRNEAYTAKSCLRCTRKSVSEFNLRYLNSIPKRVTVHTRSVGESSDGKASHDLILARACVDVPPNTAWPRPRLSPCLSVLCTDAPWPVSLVRAPTCN